MPQTQEKPSSLGVTNTLISPTRYREPEILELHLCYWGIFLKQIESSWRFLKENKMCAEWGMGSEGMPHGGKTREPVRQVVDMDGRW